MTAISVAGFLGAARLLVFPLLKRATHFVDDRFKTPGSDVALYAAFAFTFAAITDQLGIHAVFGAFIAGTLVRQVPRLQEKALVRTSRRSCSSVLSPIFFAFAGLKVDIGAGGGLWLSVVVLVIAVVTKVAGCYVGGQARRPLVAHVARRRRGHERARGHGPRRRRRRASARRPLAHPLLGDRDHGDRHLASWRRLLLRWLGRDFPM